MAKNASNDNDNANRRIDALIRMQIELAKRMDKDFTDEQGIRILHSVGLTPSEIAQIFGKKSRTSISSQLYGKKRKK